jgi:MFS family permease
VPDRGAWRLLAALTALNVLAYVDRQLVSALAPVLRAELGLTNAQVGILIGVSFIAAFALGLPVVGVLADRVNRPRLVASGLGLWSMGTALAGTASGFGSFAGWRALVGVGEATLPPTAIAMLGDRFPPARLGFATSVFYAGIPIGYALSLAFAATVEPRLGWRACFVLLGVAGLGAVASVWRLRDTRRVAAGAADGAAAVPESAAQRLRAAFSAQPMLPALMVGAALVAFTSAASQHVVNWLVHDRGYPFARAGFLAAIVLVAGSPGNLAIGAITDRARRHGPSARLYLFVGIGVVALAAAVGTYTLPAGTPLFFASWLVAQVWALGWYGPLVAAIHEMAPERSRGTVIGCALLVVNVLGVATGPWITGLVADRTSLTTGLLVSLGGMATGLLVVLVVGLALRRRR